MPDKHVVLITGAAGGIGRACVALFTQKGWHVIGVDRADFGDEFPTSGLFIKSDISRPAEMQAIFEKTHQFAETLNALVNNAALQVAKPIIHTTVEEWDAVMASNLRSVFRRQIGISAAQGWERCGRQCFLRPCHPDLGEYRRVCGLERWLAGADACDGDRVCA